jgi:threonine dehydratase
MDAAAPISLSDIRRARGVIAEYLGPSPMERSPILSRELGLDLYLKLEIFHPTRAFKVRGALNKLASLRPDERERGVVAASAGSHAQGVAYAAWRLAMPATVVMPKGVGETIVNVCRAYGAEVILEGDVYDDTLALAHEIERRDRKTFIHPYADPLIIAGQGTIGLEILEELPDVDAVIVSVGGGGLIAGIAIAVKESRASARVYGVEPEGADAVSRSLAAGRPVTVQQPHSIADKLVAKGTAPINIALIQRYVDELATVSDAAIADAMFVYLERLSLLVEGAGAASLAALQTGALRPRGKKVVLVVSGGNVPAALLARIIDERIAATARP